MEERSQFSSKFGVLAAAVGSAVGLGNIWKFPYVAGQNGGGAFLVIYLICVLVMGFPALMMEMSLGRMAKTSPIAAFRKLTGNDRWTFVGVMGALSSFMVLSFYFVVAGWSLEYIYQSVRTTAFNGMNGQDLEMLFDSFAVSDCRPYIWLTIFVILTGMLILMGVQKGIEKGSKVMMTLLFALLLFLMVVSYFTEGGREGYEFYLKPDFSKIKPSVILQALGQSFFSLSIGVGVLLTYGSYVKKGNVVTTSLQIVILDTLVAIMAGFVIFPSVFAFDIEPSEGADMAFIALPAVFSKMKGGLVIAIAFFALLAMAALTTTVSLYEMLVAVLVDSCKIKRFWANIAVGVLTLAGAVVCCHSLRPGTVFQIGGQSLFEIFDYVVSNYMLPLGALAMMVFFGWAYDQKKLHDALIGFGMNEGFYKVYMFVIRYFVPAVIVLIMLNQFNIVRI